MHRGPAPPTPSSDALDAGSVLVLLTGLFACLLCALGLVGCGREVRVELFELTSVGPSRIEAGRRIEIDGRGFPVGADASLVLTGTLHQPGFEETVELSLPVEIDAAEHAEGLVTGAFLDELGPGARGTFRGSATLLVPMADDVHGSVSGTLDDLVLDLRPNRLDLEEEALGTHNLAEWLGLEVIEDPEVGLRISSVVGGGPAARMGVVEGDALIAIDGMRVFDVDDLDGWSEHPERLEIDRGHGPVDLSARAPTEVAPDASLRALQLGLLLVVVALVLRERDRAASGRSRPPLSLQGLALVALTHALLQLGVHRLSADRLPMLLAPVVAAVVIASSATGHALRSPSIVASALGRALLLLGVVLVAALGLGTMDLGELERAQALAPTEWTLLATPAAPALMVLLAMSLPPAAPSSAGIATRILNRATEILVSAVIVLCLAGGRGEPTTLGAGLFTVRGVVVFGCLWWTRAVLSRWSWRARGVAVLGALTITLGTLAFELGPDRAIGVARASSELWLAALVVAVLLQLRPRPQPALHADLAL